MIEIENLKEFGEAAIACGEYLRDYVLIVNEADLKDQLGMVKDFPLLVCVLPAAQGDDSGMDNYAESNEAIFYVLAPLKEKYTRDERIGVWQITQKGMKELKQFIRVQMTDQSAAFYEIFQDADFAKRSIEPEYNFLGNIGWSLLFNFTTDGL